MVYLFEHVQGQSYVRPNDVTDFSVVFELLLNFGPRSARPDVPSHKDICHREQTRNGVAMMDVPYCCVQLLHVLILRF